MNISINVNQYDETKLSFGRRNPDNAKSVRSTLAKKRADKLVGEKGSASFGYHPTVKRIE